MFLILCLWGLHTNKWRTKEVVWPGSLYTIFIIRVVFFLLMWDRGTSLLIEIYVTLTKGKFCFIFGHKGGQRCSCIFCLPVAFSWKETLCQRGVFRGGMCWSPLLLTVWVRLLCLIVSLSLPTVMPLLDKHRI